MKVDIIKFVENNKLIIGIIFIFIFVTSCTSPKKMINNSVLKEVRISDSALLKTIDNYSENNN
jgi:hypothetical protein